jgi:hypothetical protein
VTEAGAAIFAVCGAALPTGCGGSGGQRLRAGLPNGVMDARTHNWLRQNWEVTRRAELTVCCAILHFPTFIRMFSIVTRPEAVA